MLLTFPLVAQYARVSYSGKGEKHDISSSHSLAYWTGEPVAHDLGGDLCLGCKTRDGKIAGKQDFKARTDVHRLGAVAGYELVEIVYTIDSDLPEFGHSFVWKSLLVSTKATEYAEIFHLQLSGVAAPLSPARIVQAGNEKILATYDSDGGNGGGCWEGYWWFDSAGPHPVDFHPVYKAIAAHTPKDSTFTEGCRTIHLDEHTIHTNVQKLNAECRPCGQLGTATAEFEIVHGIAKPARVEFTPDPQN